MSLVLENIILYSGLGCSVIYTYYFHCTQCCCCCFYKKCERESKTKEAEFNQNIKRPALQHFFIDLRSFSLTRSIFGPWHIKKDGVWILMRAAELLFWAMNRHIFSLKGFEMKLIKSYTTQTIDSRGIYLQSYPAQIHIKSLSSICVFLSANCNLFLRRGILAPVKTICSIVFLNPALSSVYSCD